MQTEEEETKKWKTCHRRGLSQFFNLPGWLVLHYTPNKPSSPPLLSFLSVSACLSVRVCGCGGLASGWWMPVGVFMVYFWPQQQKACWCSKSVAHIVSITLLLNRLAPCPWHTGKRSLALPMLPSWPWSYSGNKHWLPAKRLNRDQSHSALLAPPSYLALLSSTSFFNFPKYLSQISDFLCAIKNDTESIMFGFLSPLPVRIKQCSTLLFRAPNWLTLRNIWCLFSIK